jgi:large subunit ribosomal protein L33
VPFQKLPPTGNREEHPLVIPVGTPQAIGNDFHYQMVVQGMSRSTLRPIIKLRSTAGTGYTYVTRKSRRNDPDRLVIRKYDPVIGRHTEFREER